MAKNLKMSVALAKEYSTAFRALFSSGTTTSKPINYYTGTLPTALSDSPGSAVGTAGGLRDWSGTIFVLSGQTTTTSYVTTDPVDLEGSGLRNYTHCTVSTSDTVTFCRLGDGYGSEIVQLDVTEHGGTGAAQIAETAVTSGDEIKVRFMRFEVGNA